MARQIRGIPLKVLATREVIRNRLDNKDYLGGVVKEELDRLNWLEGKFFIDDTIVEVWMAGKILSKEEWRSRIPSSMTTYLEGKQEFSIFERSGESGEREWDLQDTDGNFKRMQLSSRIREKENGGGGEIQEDIFANGMLFKYRSAFCPKGKLLIDELDCFDFKDKKILVREQVWNVPKHNNRHNKHITIRKSVLTHREDPVSILSHSD